jgi:YgiT-type zinc finger domain-containing protein
MRSTKRDVKNGALVCSFCGKSTAEKSVVSQAFGDGATLVVIEKVPTISCSNCGEVYFDGKTLKELDRILLNKKTLTRTRNVLVAEFA